MMSALATCSATAALVLTGAVSGVFFAFSVSVMRGLDAMDPGQAITAMQRINQKILNPVFLTAFMGAPVAAAAAGALLLALGRTSAALLLFLAAAIYVLGAFLPTAVVNVPMNEALDAVEPPSGREEAARVWSAYSARWTRWNTLRAGFSLLSLLQVGLALLLWGGPT